MAETGFRVVMTGSLVGGASLSQVKQNVAALFKVPVDKVERLFGGKPMVIKQGLDEATAKKYQLALHKAGVECQVVAAATQEPAGSTADDRPGDLSASVEQASGATKVSAETEGVAASAQARTSSEASGLQKSVVKPAPADLSHLAGVVVDEPGVVLVQAQPIAEPEFDLSLFQLDESDAPLMAPRLDSAPPVDLSGLSMDEPGVVLVEPEQVVEPVLDLSGLSMDEPGVVLVEPEQVVEPELDLSGLSMDEPGTVLVEPQETPEPQIDTSKLRLEP